VPESATQSCASAWMVLACSEGISRNKLKFESSLEATQGCSMARKDEAEDWLREGLYPSAIARRMGISTKSVIQYLRTKVGEGSLRLSDVYFSWSAEKREILQQAGKKKFPDVRLLSANELSREDFDLFLSLFGSRFVGDLYEYISLTERAIHRLVRSRLEREYGPTDDGWWRKGIPSAIRVKCVSRREEDQDPAEQFAYTTLIDLRTVISGNWRLFQNEIPEQYRSDRRKLESDLTRLNGIRNFVMHPVKEKKWTDDDFIFVRSLCKLFDGTGQVR
jgi:hypothetical protein